jgi:hypothetical protein
LNHTGICDGWLSNMKPRLYIVKGKTTRSNSGRSYIHFAVVDFDVAKTYPSNFVCVLPQHVSTAAEGSSVFAKTFGDKRLELAKKLLTKALETEYDTEIKTEIRERLKLLNPKPTFPKRHTY